MPEIRSARPSPLTSPSATVVHRAGRGAEGDRLGHAAVPVVFSASRNVPLSSTPGIVDRDRAADVAGHAAGLDHEEAAAAAERDEVRGAVAEGGADVRDQHADDLDGADRGRLEGERAADPLAGERELDVVARDAQVRAGGQRRG